MIICISIDYVSSLKVLIYFPNYKIPKVITLSNNVDYLNKVILNDSLLIISIDTYLGNKNKIYNGIPNYLVEQMDVKYLSSNIPRGVCIYFCVVTREIVDSCMSTASAIC